MEKTWTFTTEAAGSRLVMLPFANDSARDSDPPEDIFPVLPPFPFSCSLSLFKKMFSRWMLVQNLSSNPQNLLGMFFVKCQVVK